jgi:hypothetical protein
VVAVHKKAAGAQRFDGAAAKRAAADTLTALRHLRPTRTQLSVIERPRRAPLATSLMIETQILEAARALEDTLVAAG